MDSLSIEYSECVSAIKPKAIIAGIAKTKQSKNFFIHFFIDNSNANISMYALSCPNFNLGQLKAYKLMFALELSMKK